MLETHRVGEKAEQKINIGVIILDSVSFISPLECDVCPQAAKQEHTHPHPVPLGEGTGHLATCHNEAVIPARLSDDIMEVARAELSNTPLLSSIAKCRSSERRGGEGSSF